MTAKDIAKQITLCFKTGGFLFLCGNGGSFDLAGHMEEEFLCKMKYLRQPLPALALKAHTSISNDFGYEEVFSRQLLAYGRNGDILLVFSTSGKSKNILKAMATASAINLTVIDFPRTGKNTQDIQEKQLKLMHKVAELVEKEFI
jgi:D-sedoheptulose 7-phosphate isomerase